MGGTRGCRVGCRGKRSQKNATVECALFKRVGDGGREAGRVYGATPQPDVAWFVKKSAVAAAWRPRLITRERAGG